MSLIFTTVVLGERVELAELVWIKSLVSVFPGRGDWGYLAVVATGDAK